MSVASPDPIALTPTSREALLGYYERTVLNEDGELDEEELTLTADGFRSLSRWVGMHDATRRTSRGSWTLWVLRPADVEERARFVARFGPDRLPRAPTLGARGTIETWAIIELQARDGRYRESHLDPGDDGVDRAEARALTLARVHVDLATGRFALMGSGLLR